MYFGALGRDGTLQPHSRWDKQPVPREQADRVLKDSLSWRFLGDCGMGAVWGAVGPFGWQQWPRLKAWGEVMHLAELQIVECYARQIQNILEQAGFLQNKMWNSKTRVACIFESSSLIPANRKDICVWHDSSPSGDVSIPFIFHVLFPLQRESLRLSSPWVSSRIIPEEKPVFQVDSFIQKPFYWVIAYDAGATKTNKNSSPCLVRRRDSPRHYMCVCAKLLQSYLTLCDPMDCSPTDSSVHGVLQARRLEWVAVAFFWGFSRPRDWTHISYVSCIGRQVLYH